MQKLEMLAASFMQAAFNVANSLGAFFGGIPLMFGLSFIYPALVGAFYGIFRTCFICDFLYKIHKKREDLNLP